MRISAGWQKRSLSHHYLGLSVGEHPLRKHLSKTSQCGSLLVLLLTVALSIALPSCALTAAPGAPNPPVNPSVTPNISNVTPGSGAVNAPVTISGANFGGTQGTSTVTFAGVQSTPTSWNGASIVTAVPVGAVTGNVVVTVGGQASNGLSFTVMTATPSITNLSPSSGVVGTAVTITGANFGTTQATSTVTFGGVPAAATSWSGAGIVTAVPAGAVTGNVVVT